MKFFHVLSFCLLSSILISCSNKKNNFENAVSVNKANIKYKNISLDSLILDSVNSSYVGETYLLPKNILFIDKKFSYVYKFDTKGKLIDRYIGQGKGKDELPIKTIMLFTFLPNGNSIFIGPSWDCFIFNPQFKKIDDYDINWHPNATREQMLKDPDPSKTYMYSLLYMGKMIATNDKVYFPLVSQHPAFNPTKEIYGKEARVLGEMDIQNGYVDKIYGKFSPLYGKDFNSLVFSYPYFDFYGEDHMVVGFPADPKIYEVDLDFNILKSFGREGRSLDKSYVNVRNPRAFHQNFNEQTQKKGYYTFLKYIKERDLTFRGYQKSAAEITDGLQIYKGDTLLGDIDVPKGFKVDGYIAPYFYSKGYSNEDKGEIKVYKFKLD